MQPLPLNNYSRLSLSWSPSPVSILYKFIAGCYWPIRVADRPIMARYRFIKNASWEGLSEIFWDIRTSTYQIYRIEEKINQTTTIHKWLCSLTPEIRWRYIEKIVEKRKNCSFFSTIICYLLLDFHVKTGTRFSLQDKRLFEMSEVEVNEIWLYNFSDSPVSCATLFYC